MGTASHEWNVTPAEAVSIQKTLQHHISLVPLKKQPKTIAGADISLERFGTELFAGIIVFSYPDLVPIEHALVKTKVTFPYVPGLLSFREIPGLLKCFEKLKTKPDVIIVDGQGIAHPRRLGIASHLGLMLDIPTIGCAKSRLYGSYEEPTKLGEEQPIKDPKSGENIGVAFKSKERALPLVISPGHNITVHEAAEIIQRCIRGYRLPEPTRLAHNLVNSFRRGNIS